eukprot:66262-Pleurochrysis_carterae.AAC.1
MSARATLPLTLTAVAVVAAVSVRPRVLDWLRVRSQLLWMHATLLGVNEDGASSTTDKLLRC